jgi:polyhydroxybutyrate depolymerase
MPATRSAGCGLSTSQRTELWNTSAVSTMTGERNYDVRLPRSYDAMTAYPVILLLHGCGSPTNNVPMEQVAGDAAIVVRGSGSKNGCWQDTASGADVPYLDAIMEDVQAKLCVDTRAWFAVGYSSGSWLANTLSCHRGDKFRGIATVSGGEPGEIKDCKGQHGRIYLHDSTDNSNRLDSDLPSRARMLKTNHCGPAMDTSAFDPAPCVEYQGCDPDYPVVWCQTSGEGHNRQDMLARTAFWNFFQRLIGEM